MEATTAVPVIMHNKYKTWYMLVTYLFLQCASGYSVVTESHPDRQSCGELLDHETYGVSAYFHGWMINKPYLYVQSFEQIEFPSIVIR